MGRFISDEEMNHLEGTSPKKKRFVSDKEMNSLESEGPLPTLQAGLEGFANGAAQGYLPQLQAATEPAFEKVGDFLTGNEVYDPDRSYTQRRDENIKRQGQQEKDYPVASLAGKVGGTITSAIPVGGAISKIPALTKAGKSMAAIGASGFQGLIENPGDEEGKVSPLQFEDRLHKGALSAAITAPLNAVTGGLSKVGTHIAARMKPKAEELAFRALGPFKRQVNQNRDNINEIGREALDSGVVRWTPGSAATIEERASSAAGHAGEELGNLTEKLTKLEHKATSSGISRKQIAENIKKKLIVENPQGIPGIDKRNKAFQAMIQEFEQDPAIKKLAEKQGLSYEKAESLAVRMGYKPKPMSFSDLRQAKMNVQGTKGQDGLINWNRLKDADVPMDEQFHRALANQLREGEEAGAEAIEKAYYGQGSNQIKTLKDKFGNLSRAANISGNRSDAQNANQILGLKSALFGSAGATTGGIVGYQAGGYEGMKAGALAGGAIGSLGNKAAKDYGAQISSKVVDSISKKLAKAPELQKAIQKYPTLPSQLAKVIGERLKKKHLEKQKKSE